MSKEHKRPSAPLEGIVYGEISAWITIIGMIIALVGLIIGFIYGGGVFKVASMMRDLFGGSQEAEIWAKDSVFSSMPEHYWFLKQRINGDELSMVGLVIACYGGVVGIWAMFISMFRKKEVLLNKKGLFTLLSFIISAIITLAATGVISIR